MKGQYLTAQLKYAPLNLQDFIMLFRVNEITREKYVFFESLSGHKIQTP